MILDRFLKHWTALNKKQIGVQEREAPLRDELYTRLLLFTVALLALQFGLLWWEGIRGWGHGPFGFAFLTAFPAGYLVAAFLARKHPFRFAALFTVVVLTVTLPIAPSSRETFQYPQFGGALLLTILLSGLLVGKSYVRIWTVACVIVQF